MKPIETFRDPDVSLWQSAVDAVVAREQAAAARGALRAPAPGPTPRPDTSDPLVAAAARAGVATGTQPGAPPEPGAQRGPVTDFFGQLKAEVKQAAGEVWAGTIDLGEYRDRLTAKFGQFDPRWAQCALKYADYYVLRRGTVPYRRHQQLNDFDITGKLPAKARIALIADWGTGLDAAFRVLGQ